MIRDKSELDYGATTQIRCNLVGRYDRDCKIAFKIWRAVLNATRWPMKVALNRDLRPVKFGERATGKILSDRRPEVH